MALSTTPTRTEGHRLPPHGEPGPLTALRRRWPVVVVATALAALSAYAVSDLVLPAVYRSSATVIVHNQATVLPDGGDVPIDPFVDDQSLSETFEQLALQPSVAAPVAQQLGLQTDELQSAVQVHAVPRTPLVVISFEAGTPAAAARGAQAYTAQFVTTTQRASFLPGRALVVSGATRPTDPVGPRSFLNALVAGAAALALSGAAVLARGAAWARREEDEAAQERGFVDLEPPATAGVRPWRPDRGGDHAEVALQESAGGRGFGR